MKRWWYLIFILLFSVCSKPQQKTGVKFVEGSFENAQQISKQQHKLLLVDFFSET
ncbi:hypothetical protein JW960_07730 [candidate division KSB1 bacterium]|nr:hypothetical protein [candidate division KSB1 bacterium]